MTPRRALRLELGLALGLVLSTAALAACLAVAVTLTGHRSVVILSGSMAPSAPVGALAVVDPVGRDALVPGDVVTVRLDSGTLLTHRVVRVTTMSGAPTLVLQGDANPPAATEVVPPDRLVGRVVAVVPIAGYVTWWLAQPAGLVAYVALIGLLLAGIGALRPPGRPRYPQTWSPVRRWGFARPAAALDLAVRLGLDRPVATLVLASALVLGSGSALQSAAIFTASASVAANTFTTGSWAPNDYRSVATGAWASAGTWQRFNGTSWVAATRPPAAIDGIITVSDGTVVTVNADVAVDQVVVSAAGQLTVGSGATLTVANGAGTDADVSGMVDAVGTMTVASGAVVAIESGAVIQDSGTIAGSGSFSSTAGTIQANGGARTMPNPVAIGAGGLAIAGSDDLTLGGVLSGTGSLVKSSTG